MDIDTLKQRLKRIADQKADELEAHDYDYWLAKAQELPFEYLDVLDGLEVAVEIMLLERNEEYIQIGVDVDYYNLPRCNVGSSAVIRKNM